MCILFFSCFCISALTNVFADSNKNRILFVVANNDEKISLETQCLENEFYSDFYDIEVVTNINSEMMNSYVAIALPYDSVEDSDICKLISVGRVYIYGALTISDYKSIMDIRNFQLELDIVDISGDYIEAGKQYLDKQYENTKIFNVICYGEVNTLLCTIEGDDITLFKYLYNVVDNFEILNQAKFQKSTILESKFDFTNDINSGRVYGIAHLDYTLYRNYDENDVDYDYFGIKTKVWMTTRSSTNDVKKLETKYELPSSSDNLLETGPASSNSVESLDISVGFGQGFNATIGFSVDLSSYTPNISRTADYTNDIVEWSLTQRSWLPKSINSATQDCIATWASLSSNSIASINLYFTGAIAVESSFGHRIVEGSYLQVPIRFEY